MCLVKKLLQKVDGGSIFSNLSACFVYSYLNVRLLPLMLWADMGPQWVRYASLRYILSSGNSLPFTRTLLLMLHFVEKTFWDQRLSAYLYYLFCGNCFVAYKLYSISYLIFKDRGGHPPLLWLKKKKILLDLAFLGDYTSSNVSDILSVMNSGKEFQIDWGSGVGSRSVQVSIRVHLQRSAASASSRRYIFDILPLTVHWGEMRAWFAHF